MDERIAAVPPPEEATLDDATRGFFARCRAKIGFVPNVFRSYARRPERFRKYQSYRNDLMGGSSGLSELEREMVAVTVSSANRCHYCVVAHGAVLRRLSGDARLGDTIVVNYRGADLPPRHRAMLDFAWKLTLEPNEIDEADRGRLRAAGLSDDDIFDLTEVAAFYNFTNRFAIGLGIAPNPGYQDMGR
ncbi:MAG: peroxidase-related enzyme [Alphaproteobacteria bacterium]